MRLVLTKLTDPGLLAMVQEAVEKMYKGGAPKESSFLLWAQGEKKQYMVHFPSTAEELEVQVR